MVKLITLCILFALAAITASAQQQNFAEIRGSTAHYDYLDYTHESEKVVWELTYIHTPGQEQLFVGPGKKFKLGDIGSANAMAYATVGTHGQLGIMPALLVSIEKNRFKSTAFLGYFIHGKGEVHNYFILDSWDTTVTMNKHIEFGVSAGFFRQDHRWNTQTGPVTRLIFDKLGSWTISERFGPGGKELRFCRVFIF